MKTKNNTLTEVAEALKNYNNFLLIAHENPDPDAYSSLVAVALALKKLGKSFHTYSPDEVPVNLKLLGFQSHISTYLEPSFRPSVVLVLDCASLRRVGEELEKNILGITDAKIINLDHHISNDYFGDINFVDITASSTAEILYDLFTEMNHTIDSETATALVTGIGFDTGFFSFSNTTPKTFRTVANLMELGAEYFKVRFDLMKDYSPETLKLMEITLKNTKTAMNSRVIYTTLSKDETIRFETEMSKVKNLIPNLSLQIKKAKLSLFFRVEEDGAVKLSLRSRGAIDCARLAANFGGGGHKDASGTLIEGALDEVVSEVLKFIEDNYEALKQ